MHTYLLIPIPPSYPITVIILERLRPLTEETKPCLKLPHERENVRMLPVSYASAIFDAYWEKKTFRSHSSH